MNRTMLAAAASLAMFGSLELRANTPVPQAPAFIPPARPLIVTRTVARTLGDGNQIVARRSYRISFVPDVEGFAIARTLIASEITAPPVLQAMAELERQRAEAVNPAMLIDRRGVARVRPGAPSSNPEHPGAEAARRMIGDSTVDPSDKRHAEVFVTQTAARGMPVPWPGDLFSPAAVDSNDSHSIALGDGSNGTVSVAQRITARLPNGAPAVFVREIVTEVAGSKQVSREEWTVSEQAAP